MKIKRIFAENYKTYKQLDLNLEVSQDRPIILIGGGNGCGKTTLFDAIYHALYGLEIKNASQFKELFNAGELLQNGVDNKSIVLQVEFSGMVLNKEQEYKLKRAYMLSNDIVRESVTLWMGGNTFIYGSGTPSAQRASNEEIVNKIIAANLPKELSYYFLFDAMKTSELLKEEQVNKLIEKNINSVMGFNKYSRLRKVSSELLSEKKTERLENENQRKEYANLIKEKQQKEIDYNNLNKQYSEALEYANDHKSDYEQLKQGRNADDVTRDKIKKLQNTIDAFAKSEQEYRQDLDNLTKDLETSVIFPKLADMIRAEVETILNLKKRIESVNDKMLDEEQMEKITKKVIDFLKEDYKLKGDINISQIVSKLLSQQKKEAKVIDDFAFLKPADVEVLEKLVSSAYSNPFVSLDERRERLKLELAEMPRRKEQLVEYHRSISKHDYSLIENYERNNENIGKLKDSMATIKDDLKKLNKVIANYDYDIPQIPDPQYDMLCKLPDFFKVLSAKLLKAKKANIERMMCEQLNVNLVIYSGVIGRVELSTGNSDEISFKMFHKDGNEIYLNQLNAGAKQTVMQVLLKVLYNLGDYEPPVMIDTVMGVLDKESREVILEKYFPDLAHQTILLSTDTEITTERDFAKIQAYVSKTYTLHRDKEAQCTTISDDYFGLKTRDF